MSDTLALLALMNKGEGLTEEQVNQVIDAKNLQPKLTAGENITISADNVISATDTGLTQEQVNTLIDSKNLQPKLTAGTNITIEGNTISATDTGLNETEVNTLIDNKNLQPKLTAGTNITIDANNVISASGGGSSYTFSGGLAETNGNVTWDLNDRIKKGTGTNSVKIGDTHPGVRADGNGSLTIGTAYNDTVYAYALQAGGTGSFAHGEANLSGGKIQAKTDGSEAGGYANNAYITVNSGATAGHAEGFAGSITVSSNNSSKDGVMTDFGDILVGDGGTNKGGLAAHAEGAGTYAYSNMQHVEGRCNKLDRYEIFQHITGNGSDNSNRSNAEALDWSGNRFLTGNVYVGCTDYTTSADGLVTANCGGKKLITEDEANTLIDNKNLQPKLTAGDNITIVDNVISATASGGGPDLSAYIAGGSKNGSLVVAQESKRGVVTADGLGSLAVGNTYGNSTLSAQAEGSAVIGYSARTILNNGAGSLLVGNVQGDAILQNIGIGSIVCGYCNSSDADVYNSGVGSLVVGMGVKNSHNTNAVFGRYNVDGDYSLVIGNGTADSSRSNALTVDWAGNIVCNNIPAAPTADGNYVLKCSIVGGVATYSWVAQA